MKMRRSNNSRTRKLAFLTCCMGINILYLGLRWNNLSAQSPSDTKQHDLKGMEQKDAMPENVKGDNDDKEAHCLDTSQMQHSAGDEPLKFQLLGEHGFVLSAYYDERAHPDIYVRIIAMQPRSLKEPVYCLLKDDDSGKLHTVEAGRYVFNENHGRPYGGQLLSCPVRGLVSKNPCFVMVSEEPDEWEGAVTLPLLRIPPLPPSHYSSEFGVCVPALHGGITVERLVDFVETTRQLGAGHFYFYRYDGDSAEAFITPAIQRATQYYVDKGLATVYPWHLPVLDKYLWYHGQVLAVHHCLYQNMRAHKYLAFNDIDEFLVPHKHETWSSLLSELDTGEYSGFKFHSAFFEPNSSKSPIALHDLQRSSHNSVLTKCMVKPERIFEMGIHHISKWLKEQWEPYSVDPDLALVHHHRQCNAFLSQRGLRCGVQVRDETMLRYREKLLQQFSVAMNELQGT